MPRRHRVSSPIPRALSFSPATLLSDSGELSYRYLTNQGSYLCPGCHEAVLPGTPHVVAWPVIDVEARRHWHTPCFVRRNPDQRFW